MARHDHGVYQFEDDGSRSGSTFYACMGEAGFGLHPRVCTGAGPNSAFVPSQLFVVETTAQRYIRLRISFYQLEDVSSLHPERGNRKNPRLIFFGSRHGTKLLQTLQLVSQRIPLLHSSTSTVIGYKSSNCQILYHRPCRHDTTGITASPLPSSFHWIFGSIIAGLAQ
jgi:hypothetical protein